MTAAKDKGKQPGKGGKAGSAGRRARLADALRANLVRRKAQARERQNIEKKEQIEQPDGAQE